MKTRASYLNQLRAAGVPDPAGDLRRLAEWAFRDSLAGIDPGRWVDAPQEQWDVFEGALEARVNRQPISQITGQRAFWRHAFEVTPDVLDPRPETEILVQTALEDAFDTVLDLGTGSGCILISLLADRTGARGLGTDQSDLALGVAGRNASALGVEPRAQFQAADWYEGVSGRFDLIVSNPPYIAASEMAGLAPEVKDWEPEMALTDGADGLTAYRAIAAGALDTLNPGGRILVEIGPTQGAAVQGLFQSAGLTGVTIRTDLDGRDRVVIGFAP